MGRLRPHVTAPLMEARPHAKSQQAKRRKSRFDVPPQPRADHCKNNDPKKRYGGATAAPRFRGGAADLMLFEISISATAAMAATIVVTAGGGVASRREARVWGDSWCVSAVRLHRAVAYRSFHEMRVLRGHESAFREFRFLVRSADRQCK